MARWTQDRDLPKLRYQADQDPRGRGWHYIWEGGGFGVQVFVTGKRKWMQCGSRKDARTGKWKSYFHSLGDVDSIKLSDARSHAARVKSELREGIDSREKRQQEEAQVKEQNTLADTSLRDALAYYIANRNCAPSSKKAMGSVLRKHLAGWMSKPLLSIDATMLLERYREIMKQVRASGSSLDARYAALSPAKRLLRAPSGYSTGVKTGDDVVEGLGRVYRYWVTKHLGKLQRAGILVPPCPTEALIDDLEPQPQRVKSVPLDDLRKLVLSLSSYEGNALHPLLVRLLLASGLRVGVTLGCRREYVRADRIVIPANADRSKVIWKKRHLEHMAYVIPRTPEIDKVLEEITSVAPTYGDAETWLFPSRTSESGHMEEERATTLALRTHAMVRFTMHQLRHNVASAAEELGYSKAEIAEILGHAMSSVTDRYIDERVKRQRRALVAVSDHLARVVGDQSVESCAVPIEAASKTSRSEASPATKVQGSALRARTRGRLGSSLRS